MWNNFHKKISHIASDKFFFCFKSIAQCHYCISNAQGTVYQARAGSNCSLHPAPITWHGAELVPGDPAALALVIGLHEVTRLPSHIPVILDT